MRKKSTLATTKGSTNSPVSPDIDAVAVISALDDTDKALSQIESWVHVGRFDAARQACEWWLASHADETNTLTGARVAEFLAASIDQLGNALAALKLYDQTLETYKKQNNIYGQCRIHYASATLLRRTGQSGLAFERVSALAKLADDSEDPLVHFYGKRAYAAGLALGGKTLDAIFAMRTAYKLARQTGQTHVIALAYTGFVSILVTTIELAAANGKMDETVEPMAEVEPLFHEAIKLCDEHQFRILQCVCLNNFASALNVVGRREESRNIVAQQLALSHEIKSQTQIAWAIANVAEGECADKNYTKAKPLFLDALTLARSINDVTLITNVLTYLIEIYKREADWQTAFTLLEEFHRVKMSSSSAFAEAQIRILYLELDNARARTAAASHEAEVKELALEAMLLAGKAEQDALTGLANRHGLERRIAQPLMLLKNGGHQLALAMIDLDDLKPINDKASHLMGDSVLKTLAAMIKEHCRRTDIAARIGGDEFVIVFDGLNDDEAKAVCQRVMISLEAYYANNPIIAGDSEIYPTISIGIADAAEATTLQALIAKADQALYRAKAGGKNKVLIH